MSDQRPRPEYGEYATPEEQARAIRSPLPVPPALERPLPPQHPSMEPAAEQSALARPSRRWDVILSAVLLAYGAANVVSGLGQFADVPRLIDQVFAAQGVGEFTPTSNATTVGIVINVTNVVLYLIALVLTVLRLRRGRLAFWIPLTAGVAAGLFAGVLIVSLMVGDPAFLSQLSDPR